MKKTVIILVILLGIGGLAYYMTQSGAKSDTLVVDNTQENTLIDDTTPTEPPVVEDMSPDNEYEVIGKSVEDREIQAYRFGTGEKTLVYVGAIHGGYEWNSALLSYELIDYLKENTESIPSDLEIVVIPVASPDGLYKVVGTSERFVSSDAPQFNFADELSLDDVVVSARFNANNVDINRNFDCSWQPEATWRDYTVSGGTEAFSEPEAAALRDFFLTESPEAVVFFHSASNGIYTSFCGGEPLAGTTELLKAYSDASGYQSFDDYTYYEVTGDAADWLSTQNIPAITVELSTHEVIEFDKNLAGIKAMFDLYSTDTETIE